MSDPDPTSADDRWKGRLRPFLFALSVVTTALDWSGRVAAVACLSVMFVALFVNVVLRYAFGEGITWAYEIHALLLPWLVAGGIVVAAARGRNIAISLLPDMLGPAARWSVGLAVRIAVLAICVSVLWTIEPILVAARFQTLSTLGIKQIWGYYSIVYAFGAMAAIAAVDILRALGGGGFVERAPGQTSLS